MQLYDRIPIWENKRRGKLLTKLHGLLITYYDQSHHPRGLTGRSEQLEAKKARFEINYILEECCQIVASTGVNSILTVTPPPAVGGYVKQVDVLTNFSILDDLTLRGLNPMDFVQRAIGVYEGDRVRAWIRTFNPIFWISQVFLWLISFPFHIIGIAGFDRQKAEDSLWGKLFKALAGFAVFVATILGMVATILTILESLGLLEGFKALIGLSKQ
jgi:hypothetical protein